MSRSQRQAQIYKYMKLITRNALYPSIRYTFLKNMIDVSWKTEHISRKLIAGTKE